MLLGTKLGDFVGSRVSRATVGAYLSTEYRAWGGYPLVLRIGERNDELARIYREQQLGSAAVVTAWNPFSQPRAQAENEAAQGHLIDELERRGLRHQPGEGADPTGTWPPEASRLVLGISLEAAAALGRQFQQNGVVWASQDATPQLLLLR